MISRVTGSVYGVVRVVGEPRVSPKVEEDELECVDSAVRDVEVREIVLVDTESRLCEVETESRLCEETVESRRSRDVPGVSREPPSLPVSLAESSNPHLASQIAQVMQGNHGLDGVSLKVASGDGTYQKRSRRAQCDRLGVKVRSVGVDGLSKLFQIENSDHSLGSGDGEVSV